MTLLLNLKKKNKYNFTFLKLEKTFEHQNLESKDKQSYQNGQQNSILAATKKDAAAADALAKVSGSQTVDVRVKISCLNKLNSEPGRHAFTKTNKKKKSFRLEHKDHWALNLHLPENFIAD